MILLLLSLTAPAAVPQLAMQVDDEQVARICAENGAMVECLNGVYARQQATLRAIGESPPQSLESMIELVGKQG